MKNKYVDLALILLIIFLLVSYFFIRQEIYDNKIDLIIMQLEKHTANKNWLLVKQDCSKLKQKWHEKKYILLLNFASEEYLFLDDSIEKMLAGADLKDNSLVLSNLYVFDNLWGNIQKFVPEP